MADELLPRFITNREVDPLLGSTRTRERWEREGLLPPGELISGYRSKIKIFTSLSVARLAAPKRIDEAKTLHEHWGRITRRLYRRQAFTELRQALKEALTADLRPIGVTDLVAALLPDRRDELQAFASEIRRAEDDLRALDISLEISLAKVIYSEKHFYVVEHVDGSGQIEVSRDDVPHTVTFDPGDWVAYEKSWVRGFRRELLLPTALLGESPVPIRNKGKNTSMALRMMDDALDATPAPVTEWTTSPRLISAHDEMQAGRVGVINTEEPLKASTRALIDGPSYRKAAFK